MSGKMQTMLSGMGNFLGEEMYKVTSDEVPAIDVAVEDRRTPRGSNLRRNLETLKHL